jgi:hypothetical protein
MAVTNKALEQRLLELMKCKKIYRHDFTKLMDLLDFHKIVFANYLKHSCFFPSVDVKPMSNDLWHTMPLQCMFTLSEQILESL